MNKSLMMAFAVGLEDADGTTSTDATASNPGAARVNPPKASTDMSKDLDTDPDAAGKPATTGANGEAETNQTSQVKANDMTDANNQVNVEEGQEEGNTGKVSGSQEEVTDSNNPTGNDIATTTGANGDDDDGLSQIMTQVVVEQAGNSDSGNTGTGNEEVEGSGAMGQGEDAGQDSILRRALIRGGIKAETTADAIQEMVVTETAKDAAQIASVEEMTRTIVVSEQAPLGVVETVTSRPIVVADAPRIAEEIITEATNAVLSAPAEQAAVEVAESVADVVASNEALMDLVNLHAGLESLMVEVSDKTEDGEATVITDDEKVALAVSANALRRPYMSDKETVVLERIASGDLEGSQEGLTDIIGGVAGRIGYFIRNLGGKQSQLQKAFSKKASEIEANLNFIAKEISRVSTVEIARPSYSFAGDLNVPDAFKFSSSFVSKLVSESVEAAKSYRGQWESAIQQLMAAQNDEEAEAARKAVIRLNPPVLGGFKKVSSGTKNNCQVDVYTTDLVLNNNRFAQVVTTPKPTEAAEDIEDYADDMTKGYDFTVSRDKVAVKAQGADSAQLSGQDLRVVLESGKVALSAARDAMSKFEEFYNGAGTSAMTNVNDGVIKGTAKSAIGGAAGAVTYGGAVMGLASGSLSTGLSMALGTVTAGAPWILAGAGVYSIFSKYLSKNHPEIFANKKANSEISKETSSLKSQAKAAGVTKEVRSNIKASAVLIKPSYTLSVFAQVTLANNLLDQAAYAFSLLKLATKKAASS